MLRSGEVYSFSCQVSGAVVHRDIDLGGRAAIMRRYFFDYLGAFGLERTDPLIQLGWSLVVVA